MSSNGLNFGLIGIGFIQSLSAAADYKDQISLIANHAVDVLQKKRLQDLELTVEFLHLKKMNHLSRAQVSEFVTSFSNRVARSASLLKTDGKEFETWNGQKVTIEDSYYSKWFTNQVSKAFEKRKSAILKSFDGVGSDGEIFSKLVKLAQNRNESSSFSKVASPYEARMILTEYLLSAQNDSEKKEFLKKLSLTFDIRDVVSKEEYTTLTSESCTSSLDCIIVHDGYIYGALRENAERTLTSESKSLSYGIDCSSFVQSVLEHTGFTRDYFPVPISTRKMIEGNYKAAKEGYFAISPLKKLEELAKGDVIVWSGHTQIVLSVSGEIVQVAEAVGGVLRTMRVSNERFSDLSKHADGKALYRLRVNKLPQIARSLQ